MIKNEDEMINALFDQERPSEELIPNSRITTDNSRGNTYSNDVTASTKTIESKSQNKKLINELEKKIKSLESQVESYEQKIKGLEYTHRSEVKVIESKWEAKNKELYLKNQQLEIKIKDLEAKLKAESKVKKVTKEQLRDTIPKLVLLTQVFGKIYETVLNKSTKPLVYSELRTTLEEY